MPARAISVIPRSSKARWAAATCGAPPSTRISEGGYANLLDRKSTRLNSSHVAISYAVFCLKKKKGKRPSSCSLLWSKLKAKKFRMRHESMYRREMDDILEV